MRLRRKGARRVRAGALNVERERKVSGSLERERDTASSERNNVSRVQKVKAAVKLSDAGSQGRRISDGCCLKLFKATNYKASRGASDGSE